MPATDVDSIGRRQCIPIIYTRGTHYEVGFDVGRTFAAMIHEFLQLSKLLNEEYLPAYETSEGRKVYDATINTLKENFPQYVEELQGTADGAQVPFHHLFLMHLDNIILTSLNKDYGKEPHNCSTVCLNQHGQECLGHNEDASSESLNSFYFVSAHVISDKPQGRWKVTEEKFTSLCYPGHLPGYTMSFNHHGLICSINTLLARNLIPGKTPRHFLSRALLNAENFSQVEQILKDYGTGTADGCSFNLTFLNQEGNRLFHNIEMAPGKQSDESELNIMTSSCGENLLHTNSYLRLAVKQADRQILRGSDERMITLKSYPEPKLKKDVFKMLSDESNKEWPVFRRTGFVRTIAVGIFDCIQRTWSLYSDDPANNDPLIVIPLVTKH